MPTANLTLPEARERVDWLANYSAEFDITLGAREGHTPDLQEVVEVITSFLRECDGVLLGINPTAATDPQEARRLVNITRGLRKAFYHVLVAMAPELGSYWTLDRQAQLRSADLELTPESRARMLAEASADYARLRADPAAWADLIAEDALFEGALADGLDDQ